MAKEIDAIARPSPQDAQRQDLMNPFVVERPKHRYAEEGSLGR